jgi:hypothetical protein
MAFARKDSTIVHSTIVHSTIVHSTIVHGLRGIWWGMTSGVSLHVLAFALALLKLDWAKKADETAGGTSDRDRDEGNLLLDGEATAKRRATVPVANSGAL